MPTLLAIVTLVAAMAVWHCINTILYVVVWATGQLIPSDKKIVAYMSVVSLFSFLLFGGLAALMIMSFDKLAKLF